MDMLVKLYDLPSKEKYIRELEKTGVKIRVARAYEKTQIICWVHKNFSREWADECSVAFSNHPVSCLIAVARGELTGFACYDCTCRNFFGPIGVAEQARGHGAGKALLLTVLEAMAACGYAYAIIGGVDNARDFYKTAIGAVEIPGSSPGIYCDRLQAQQD